MAATTMSHLASLSLFPATSEQIEESRKRSAVSWAVNMTLEEYLTRDKLAERWDSARDGRLVTWVLAPRDDPSSLDFCCSCETYRRPGAVVQNGEPARVHCYGIASVYTPEYNRGKGYASRMMRLLHWVLAPSGALGPFPEEWGMAPKIPSTVLCADATFSSLWSDVGAFYGACGPSPSTNGWEIQGNVSTVWQIGESSRSEPLNDSKGWRWMESDEVSKCWEGESHRMIGDMCDQSHDATSSLFAFLPENGVAEFQRLRMLSRLQKAGIYLAFWGLSANSGPQDGLVTWTVELNGPPTLIVTRFRAKEHSDYKTIILGLLEYAKSQGLQRMEIWGLPPQVHEVASETGGQTVQREEHLPAYRWYGAQTDVVWAFNEKYCWC